MADTPFFRVALRYKQYDRRWWEVFGSNKSTIQQIMDLRFALRDAALAFRHPSVYLSHVRVSNPFAPRQADIKHFDNPNAPIGTAVPETTSNSGIYEFAGTDAGVKRHIWIRGLREADVKRRPSTGVDFEAGDLHAGVVAYFDYLRTNGFGIPNVQPVDGTANARHPIDSITVLPLRKVKCNVSEAFVLGDRKRVILYRIEQKLFPGLRGRFTVTADATGFVPIGYSAALPEGTYELTGAAFRKEEFRFTPFVSDGCTFLAFDRRDTSGGPLDTRGHSRPLIRRSR